MRSFKNLAVIIAAASISMISAQDQTQKTAPATPARPTPPATTGQPARPIQRFDRSLQDLTDEQRKKIEETNKAYADASTPLYRRLTSARHDLETLIGADKIDEAAVRAKAKEIGDLEGDLAIARAQRYAKFRTFLTPDQARRLSMPTIARPFQPMLHDVRTPPGATNR